ncbi:MAG: DNA translocase FtsK [Chloroflexi bacterium]|nr:DNA translocase FtsK [Chloroflexota bacterium]
MMALTETARRRPAAARRSRGDRRLRRWLQRAAVAAVLAAVVALALTLWHPRLLQELLAPWWRALGPASLLVPLWGAALYIGLRWDARREARRWRWWTGALLAMAALEALPNAVGGLSWGWVPLESGLGAALAGGAGPVSWLRTLLLAGAAASFLFPRLVWRWTKAGARAALQGLVLGVRRILAWRNGPGAPVVVPTLAPFPEAESPLAPTGKAKRSRRSAEATPPADDGRPRIILPAQALGENEGELAPEPGVLPTEADASPPLQPPGDPTDPFGGLPLVRWRPPPLDAFAPEPAQQIDHGAHFTTAAAIEATLGEYGIEAQVTEIRPGPTVTLYGLRPGWSRRYREVRERDATGALTTHREEVGKVRIKVERIAALDRDLTLQLRAPSIRIEAPIAGTNLIGIEVPNPEPQLVVLRSLLQSDAFRRARERSRLAVPLGKGSGGEALVADLAKMPHLLIAGATGSGKSVFINVLIASLLFHTTPREVRLLLVDPKRVELPVYNGTPHLLTPVIVDPNKVVNALRWLALQMERRLQILAEAGVRDIASYNRKREEAERMPYLVFIVDELADLMLTAGKAVEQGLVRLAQMGRATGIHLVVATQRPSVDVVTGLIKANFPTRVSFMVTSQVDSRTILDGGGAEKLLGRGDMLYLPQDAARPRRVQGAYISEEEAEQVAAFWRDQARGYRPPELPELLAPEDLAPVKAGARGSADDEMMDRARELAQTYSGRISTSLLQRRLGVGYPRAARMRDILVEEGLASPDIPNAPAEARGRGQRSSDDGDL